ncbi:MAG TPA: type II secretion system protein [Sedimentisphaerales bacterium]|nr:type II secretion system protein [Sedimentisphaerales bacterium]
MKRKLKQSGVTLVELTVTMAIVVLLAVVGVPAVRALVHSFESGSSTRAMIGAAMASARAISAREQQYVGIRFQKAYSPQGSLRAPQYMIFIIHDMQATGLAYGFRAIEGLKPIKLPDSVGVMDASLVDDVNEGWEPASDAEVTDLTSFSIVFTPAGKLVIHDVRVARTSGSDDVFNTLTRITAAVNPAGMFVEDNPEDQEPSGNSLIIYDRKRFEQAYRDGQGYSGYLVQVPRIYINPYMGTMISTE